MANLNLFHKQFVTSEVYVHVALPTSKGSGSDKTLEEVIKEQISSEYKTTLLLQISHCLFRLDKNQTLLQIFIQEKKLVNEGIKNIGKLTMTFYQVLTGRELSKDAYLHLVSDLRDNKKVGRLLSEEDCDDPSTAQDLIEQMISEEIFTIKDVLQHPFFWSKRDKINFICKAYDRLFPEDKITENVVKKYNIDDNEDVIISEKGWIEKLTLTRTEMSEIYSKNPEGTTIGIDAIHKCAFNNSGNKKFKEHSIFDLMRFFRIHHTHYWEKDEKVQTAFGDFNDRYWKFYHRRFPKLFIHIYHIMTRFFSKDNFSGKVAPFEYLPKKK